MKQTFIRKSAVTILLLIIAFGALGVNILSVKADAVGIGKFLEVEIVGQGYVTATKVQSGEVWTYLNTDPPTEHKLGAGTVSLQAYATDGWKFSHWEGDLTGTKNPTDYKSQKYGFVKAVFEKDVFTITATVAYEAPNGYIETEIDGVATQIYDQLAVSVEYGDSQTFDFNAYTGNHVSAIQVDGAFIAYSLTHTFTNVQEDHTLTVYFSVDGQAYVPTGTNVPVFLGDAVGLTFPLTTGGGTATQAEVILDAHPDLQGTSLILWSINVGVSFTGIVEITLPYAGTTVNSVWASDSLDALYSDVTGDGLVNGDDVSDVANAIKTLVPHGIYDANYDIDRNGVLDQYDVHMVNANKGAILEPLAFEVIGTTLYIWTPHFSIFRGR